MNVLGLRDFHFNYKITNDYSWFITQDNSGGVLIIQQSDSEMPVSFSYSRRFPWKYDCNLFSIGNIKIWNQMTWHARIVGETIIATNKKKSWKTIYIIPEFSFTIFFLMTICDRTCSMKGISPFSSILSIVRCWEDNC